MELGPQNHYGDGLLGPNSIMVVYMAFLLFMLRFRRHRFASAQGGWKSFAASFEKKAVCVSMPSVPMSNSDGLTCLLVMLPSSCNFSLTNLIPIVTKLILAARSLPVQK